MLVASDTHALRPAFRELGHVAAFVFEAIEDERAATITTLLQAAGISRNAVSAVVDVLAAHGLVEHSPTGLVAHPERLGLVAELVGDLDVVTVQLRRYARDRQIWHVYLAHHEPDNRAIERDGTGGDSWGPPDDADDTWPLGAMVAA